MKLDDESQGTLDKRAAVGDRCCAIAWEGLDTESYYIDNEEDRECAAKDAISDVLTTLFGPAGVYRLVEGNDDSDYEPNHGAQEAARNLLNLALDAWYGDAEDYTYIVD